MKLILFWAAALSAAAETIPYYDLSGPWRLQDGQTEREINIPSRMPTGRYRLEKTLRLDPGVSAPLALVVDSISGSYRVSVNGVRVGEAGQWGTPWIPVVAARAFEIPPGALSPELTITIEVDRPSLPIVIRGLGGGQARRPIVTTPRMAAEIVEARSRDRQVRQAPSPFWMFTGFLFACFIWLAGRNQPGRANLWLSGAFVANALFDVGDVLRLWAPGAISEYGLTLVQAISIALVPVLTLEFALRYLDTRLPWWRWLGYVACYIVLLFGNGTPAEMAVRWLNLAIFALLLLFTRRRHNREALAPIALLTAYQALSVVYRGGIIPPAFFLGPVQVAIPPLFRSVFGVLMVIELFRRAMADREERRRMAAELAAAQQVQRLVISSSLSGEHQGWVVESSYLPMREVGGDFFQAWESPRGLLLAVGDVSGKGLKAAMTVSLVVGALRQTVSDEPAEILAGLNSVLLRSKDPAQFVTCCVMRLEPNGSAVVAHAGHLPLYVDDGVLELEGSLPLGVVEEAEYRPQSTQARRAITVISDGVVEAANAKGELFGFERTQAISAQSAQAIADAAQQWGQNDDITVVTVQRRAAA